MMSLLAVLVFLPVILGLAWIYLSPLPRLDGYTSVKVIIRIVLFMAIFGGCFAQFNFLAHHLPSNTRNFYGMAFIVIEAIPMLFILFYRAPRRDRSERVNLDSDGHEKKSNK